MSFLHMECPTCKKATPHKSVGYNTTQTEADGRVSQEMACAECKTSTRVYFTPGTNEFQENLDVPDNTGA